MTGLTILLHHPTRLLIPIAAIVVAVGLTAGLAGVRPVDSRVRAIAPVASTALPLMTLTAPVVVAQDPLPVVLPTAVAQPQAVPPRPLFEGPFSYGRSFDGRSLLAYRFGTGPSARIIVGGIHGGYEWNTVLLGSETLRYLRENPSLVPEDITLYVIPCANPDGYAAGTDRERGRMNGNGVDLNRNWDYHWQPTATHGVHPVHAGAYAFSEPETAALRDFILERDVEAAIFYHSAMARVFYGAERDRSATYELARIVSEATGYAIAAGVPGQIGTGDAIDWMSAEGLAGVEVELTTHDCIEWERNLPGLLAFLNWRPLPTEQLKTPYTRSGTAETSDHARESRSASQVD
jgi:hypothetical protein